MSIPPESFRRWCRRLAGGWCLDHPKGLVAAVVYRLPWV